MKFRSRLVLLVVMLVAFTFSGSAQDRKSPAEASDDLRTQLSEVQAKEAELQARVKQLEEDLKPENIERYFAGVGSTRPEDLRAFRKTQLEREKSSVQRQLELLAQRRARLESAILRADAAAYQQSAQGLSSAPAQSAQGSSSGDQGGQAPAPGDQRTAQGSSSDDQGGQAPATGDRQTARGPSTTEPLLAAQSTAMPRWLIPLAAVIAMLAVGFLIFVIRKVRKA